MNRFEPNLLLAVSTGVALLLLIMTASVFGEPDNLLKYAIIALLCPPAFIFLGRLQRKRMGWKRPPMIHPEAPSTAIWASVFPLVVMILAAVPMFFSGFDYGLMIVIAAVFFGQTVDSALKARPQK